jgi:hypothetical protein
MPIRKYFIMMESGNVWSILNNVHLKATALRRKKSYTYIPIMIVCGTFLNL